MQRVQKAQAGGGQPEADHGRAQGQVGPLARHLRVPQQRRYRADGGFAGAAACRNSISARPRSRRPPAAWNVLAEDYWDLYTLLLR